MPNKTTDRERLDDLERRVGSLEAQLRARREEQREATGLDFELLERLAQREAGAPIAGALIVAGSVRRGERRAVWQREHTARDLIEAIDPEAIVGPIFALAHPVRLRIVLALLRDPQTTSELAELAGAGSMGQLYHHLAELAKAGLISQPARGRYEIDPARVMPILAIVAASVDIGAFAAEE